MSQNLLENLNEEQLAAVTHTNGPLMIIAGAGTGKTTVVTQRIAWLIEQGHAKSDEVLALTFTDKAAGEMEERVDMLLPIGYLDLWISTFHAFCERILRAHALEIGLPHEFKLFSEVDILLLMRRNFDRFKLDYYRPRGNPTRFLKALMQHFSRVKDELVTPSAYLAFAESLRSGTDQEEIARIEELANAYHTYQQILLEKGAMDFADLISYTIELLRSRPTILKHYQHQFKFILVDEFQDTNTAQYELVKLLAGGHKNLTVVGDDDQSIYKFRGASLDNILHFRKDFPDAKSIVLNKNYRSTREVLTTAYTSICGNNPHRLEVKEALNKQLHAQTGSVGSVTFTHCGTEEEEVAAVLERILTLKQEQGTKWSDLAILVRANDSAETFTLAMDRARIPFRFMAMSGLYTKSIILDALAWMRAVDQPHESPTFYRILSHPRLGIAEHDIQQLTLFCRRKGVSLYDAVKSARLVTGLTPEGHTRLHEILTTISALAVVAKRAGVSELFLEIMKQTGLLGDVRLGSELSQMEQFSILNQFADRLKKFEAANDDKTSHHFLLEFDHERDAGEVGALKGDPEAGPDVVNVMTVHGSKGLEFKHVFLVNLVEQRFPSTRRSEAIPMPDGLICAGEEDKDAHIREERRLFYVALTRAKVGLHLYAAEDYGGTRKRKVSRFVQELKIERTPSASITFATENTEPVSHQPARYQLPKSISFTQIAAFSTCPMQYKFAHILKVPVFGRHSLSFGKTMHNTLQKFTEAIKNQQATPQASLFDVGNQTVTLPSEASLLAMYKEAWIDEWYPDQAIKQEYQEKGRTSLLGYRQHLAGRLPTIAFIEKGFTLKVGEVVLRGRIDRIDKIDGGYEIMDYKTGTPKEKLSWEDKRQLILYLLAAEQCFDPPLQIKKLTYHYLENNTSVSFEATEKDREKLQNEIRSTVLDINASGFGATPGFHCQYCDFKDICEFSQS